VSTRVLLAYNGDFAATVAIRWLIETHGVEVATVTLDLGQRRDPAEARERALAAGAVRAHVLDVRDEFARDCILPALRAESFDHRDHADVLTLAWPLIARKLVELAAVERAAAVAHGSRDAAIETFVHALDPQLVVLAPARAWQMTPPELTDWARVHRVPVLTLPDHACKIEENLWGRAVTWIGRADDEPVPDDIRRMARTRLTPDAAAFLEITFERETPVAVNGVPMALPELIESVSVIAGEQGLGRVERSTVNEGGTITRMIVDAPAPAVLHAAYLNRASATNTVRLKLSGGQQTVISEMVNHA
jgi:argininosuccinate synthase